MRHRFIRKSVAILVVLAIVASPYKSFAVNEVTELQDKISGRTTDIKNLEAEIVSLEKDISKVGSQKKSLQNTLQEIELTRKKLTADITLTGKKIDSVTLSLRGLENEIGKKGTSIETSKEAIAESARGLREFDNRSLIEIMLGEGKLGNVLDEGTNLIQLTEEINRNLLVLRKTQQALKVSKDEVDKERNNLLLLKRELAAKKQVEDGNRTEQLSLIKETSGQESKYKKMLDEKKILRSAFEAELYAFEAQLKIAIDPSTLPKAGSKALLWPVRNVLVTQEFGDTAFSKTSLGAAYNGKGHNGIDLRASVGTSLFAAASGTVLGTGNTDETCKGASYGKWVLIEHTNGLTTLYGHMSFIGVSKGQHVASGDLIGYSGNTGYSTGPHLHFSVFASKGVSVGQLKSKNAKCGTYTLPIASFNSYLNPLLFL